MQEKKNFFNFIYSLENTSLYRYAYIYLLLLFILILGINSFFYFLEKKIILSYEKINNQRNEINSIVIKKSEYEELKKKSNDIILKDVSFRIKDYVLSVINNLKLNSKIINGGDSVNEQTLKEGYSELSMSFELNNLGIEEVIKIIRTCEEDQRVYFKEIIINNDNNKTLSLFFVIATIQIINEG